LLNVEQIEIDESEIAKRRLCSSCVREQFLRGEIEQEGETARCSYCEGEGKTISIEKMAERVDAAFEQHFELTPNEPSGFEYTMMKETDYEWHRDGQRVVNAIADAADISNAPAEDIRLVLADRHYDHEREKMGEEGPFDEATYYTERGVDDIEFLTEWSAFENNLKKQARFFSRTAHVTLAKIFDSLREHKTRDGRKAVVDAGPGKPLVALYRARVFQSDAKIIEALKRPDLEVGSPPWRSAPAGRMNARGISVFYGATNVDTALAEVRPPVGSRVAVARFELIRPVRFLDVEVLREVFVEGSVFDAEYLWRLKRATFLGRLSERMTRPVMPDDEPFDYLVTQAIADYLATEMNLDGMIYPSAQTELPNANVVVFHHAARIEPLEIPKDTAFTVQLDMYTEEGSEIDYWVWEEVPSDPPVPPTVKHGPLEMPSELLDNFLSGEIDDRLTALKIDVSSLEIYHVSGATIVAQPYPVMRHRSKARK
jgi:RES domain